MKWSIIDKDIHKYLEYVLLPNLISFSIYRLYVTHKCINDSYITIHNTIKSYINIVNENDYLIYRLVVEILKNKYKLQIVTLTPLSLKKY